MRRVVFALLPDCVMLDVAGPAEAFRIANQRVPGTYTVEFTAPMARMRTSIGLELTGLGRLPRDVEAGSLIVLPGLPSAALDFDAESTRMVTKWLQGLAHQEATLVCVCAGALLAGRAGLLSGRDCTTHHAHTDDLRRVAPDARVHDNRIFVEDGGIYTSAGITAGIDLALYLIGRDLGPKVAAEVAREMVVYVRRAGADPALSPWFLYRNHLHPVVHRVQDAVTMHPASSWSASALARVGCTSPRHLARLFAEHAGCSPLDYVQRVRVTLARELLQRTDLGIERIAERSGFSSAQQLRRVWRRWERGSPRESRSGVALGVADS
jgi:transcriptional regulator GlxA family with amidase domain